MINKTYYCVIEEKRSNGELGEYITYGIRAECGGESELISDITPDRATAEKLAESFNRNELSLIHFSEVIEDILN